MIRKAPEPPLLTEIDQYLSALSDVERRVCDALAAGGEATFRLAVKVDRGKIVSLRLESNEDLAGQADKTSRFR